MKSKPRFSELLPASCCLTSLSYQQPRLSQQQHFHHHRHKKQAAAIPLPATCNRRRRRRASAVDDSPASSPPELQQLSTTSTSTTAYDIAIRSNSSCGRGDKEDVTSHNNRSIRICCSRGRKSRSCHHRRRPSLSNSCQQPCMSSQINHLAFHDKDFLTSSGYCLSSSTSK